MTISEKQKYSEQFEDIIYRLAYLMLDTMKVTLNTLDDYHQLFEENSNQNALDDMPETETG
jgi:hypothetical protein